MKPTRRPANPWQRQYTKPAPLDPGAVVAAMWALTPTTEAQARVEAMGERWAERAALKEEATPSARTGNDNFKRGMEAEARARRELRARGWFINSSRTGSFGAADVIAHRTEAVAADDRPSIETLHVQVKRRATFTPSALNEAVSDFRNIAAKRRMTAANGREAWLWVDGEGWVAVAVLGHNGAVVVSGARGEAVGRSLARVAGP